MEKIERIGIVVNPKAGNGVKRNLIKKVINKLSPRIIYGGLGKLGEDYFKDSEDSENAEGFEDLEGFKGSFIKLEFEPTGKVEDTIRLVKSFNEIDLDAVVVFGGDGTMSDASTSKHPLLCIPIGTTNVSPLIFNDSTTFSVEEIDPRRFVIKEIDGLVVKVDDSHFNAFNDVVVGSTILSTVDGRKTQIDAEAFLEGRKVESKPRKFYARVEIVKEDKVLKSIEGTFGNVFVSLTGKRYLGKGIAGGAAISTFAGFKAVVACTNEGMLYYYSKEELRRVEPFVTTSLSFDEGEKVRIYSDEVISRDGTPIKRGGYAEIEYRKGLVKVLKLKG